MDELFQSGKRSYKGPETEVASLWKNRMVGSGDMFDFELEIGFFTI